MRQLKSLSLAGLALIACSVLQVAGNASYLHALAMARGAGKTPDGTLEGAFPHQKSSSIVHDKKVIPSHGQATLNAYVDAHCWASSDAVALGGALAGPCGGPRAEAPGAVRA